MKSNLINKRFQLRASGTESKISSFLDVEEGWHYGEGVRPSETTALTALELCEAAVQEGFFESDAFLGSSGEIQLSLYDGRNFYDFTVEPDSTVTFCHERERQIVRQEVGIDVMGAIRVMRSLRQPWFSTDWSNFQTGTSERDAFRAWNSGLLPGETGESQWSQSNAIWSVRQVMEFLPVNACETSIQPSTPWSTGGLIPRGFQKIVA
jgi:hypothetical protein